MSVRWNLDLARRLEGSSRVSDRDELPVQVPPTATESRAHIHRLDPEIDRNGPVVPNRQIQGGAASIAHVVPAMLRAIELVMSLGVVVDAALHEVGNQHYETNDQGCNPDR